jgi:transcriptional regulator with XRE-family HTH domain
MLEWGLYRQETHRDGERSETVGVSNHQFAEKVGCNYTMASRLRNGKRTPSAQMLVRICAAFNLDMGQALQAYANGREAMAQWLRDEIFDKADKEDVPVLARTG